MPHGPGKLLARARPSEHCTSQLCGSSESQQGSYPVTHVLLTFGGDCDAALKRIEPPSRKSPPGNSFLLLQQKTAVVGGRPRKSLRSKVGSAGCIYSGWGASKGSPRVQVAPRKIVGVGPHARRKSCRTSIEMPIIMHTPTSNHHLSPPFIETWGGK